MKTNSVRAKILFTVLPLIFFSLGIIILINSIGNLRATEQTVETILGETSKTAALVIESELKNLSNIVADIGATKRLASNTELIKDKLSLLEDKAHQHGFASLGIADKNGLLLDGKSIPDNELKENALNGKIYISSPVISSDGKSSEFFIAAPLWSDGIYNSKVVGIVYASIDSVRLSSIISSIKVGETGTNYIVNKEGTTIADNDYSLVLSQENSIEEAKTDKTLEKFAEQDSKAINGTASYGTIQYTGKNFLVYTTPIKGSDNWALGVMVEKSEFLAPTYTVILISSIVSLLALVLTVFFMIRFAGVLTKPIIEIESAIEEMAKGNYDINISVKSNDEIGRMAKGLNSMIEITNAITKDTVRALEEMAGGNFDLESNVEYVGVFKRIGNAIINIMSSLSEAIATVKISTEQVSSGSEQVSAGAQALSQGATEQASSIEELSATISEISEKIMANAEDAKTANEITIKTGHEVDNGNRLMQEMLIAMDEINTKSNEIKRIVKTIEDIAFQTNILALNAAVEAARAGTAGKGFGVVAEEVRNLAQRSSNAVKDTTELIEASINAAQNGKAIADETAVALTSIVKMTAVAIEKIDNISKSSSAQAESISQVTMGVEQISAVTQTNSATSEESAAASQELSSQASMLNELLGRFKIQGGIKNV